MANVDIGSIPLMNSAKVMVEFNIKNSVSHACFFFIPITVIFRRHISYYARLVFNLRNKNFGIKHHTNYLIFQCIK